MTNQEYRFYSNPEDRRISGKWLFVPLITFVVMEIVFTVTLIEREMFNLQNMAIAQLAVLLFCALSSIRAIFGRRWRSSAFKIRYNYRIIISDCLTRRTSEFEDRTIENDGLPNERFLDDLDISIQWEDIKSCKINKSARMLTVKDMHGRQIVVGREFEEHLTIWSLIIERAKQASPDAEIDNLIIQHSEKSKELQ